MRRYNQDTHVPKFECARVYRSRSGWGCGAHDAAVLPVWRHGQHGFEDGVEQPTSEDPHQQRNRDRAQRARGLYRREERSRQDQGQKSQRFSIWLDFSIILFNVCIQNSD